MPGHVRFLRWILAGTVAGLAGSSRGGGAPDLAHPVAVDLDIRHVAGCEVYTTSDTGIEDDGLAAGYWAGIRMGDDVPVTYFQIVSNRYTQQENITVFTFAGDMEGGSSKWWFYTECQHFNLYPPRPEPVPVEIQWTKMAPQGVSQFVVTGAGELPCTVEASFNLNDWESLATTVRAGGLLQLTDSATNPVPLRVYRIRAGN